jgi:hypothetical protein
MRALALVLGFVFGVFAVASADVILGWDLAGYTTDPLPATTIATGLSTAGGLNQLTRMGLSVSSSNSAFGSSAWNISATFSNANDYISFQLTPAADQLLTLTDISWSRINGSNTGPRNGRWGYSLDGVTWTYQTDFTNTFANASGAWDFPDISDTTSNVEFRYWAWGATSINGGTSASGGSVTYRDAGTGDDIVLNGGITAVPEPGVLALLSLGGLAVLSFARRRRA